MTYRSLDDICQALQIPETEDSWDRIAKAIQDLTSILQDYDPEDTESLIPTCRQAARPLVSAATSERTRLSGPALDAIAAIASALCRGFDTLLPLYFPTLLVLCGRANKIVSNRARGSLFSVIESTQLPAILTYLIPYVKDKSTAIRIVSTEGVLACLNKFNPPDLEKGSRPAEIEGAIRSATRDANADVRKIGKKIFEAYKIIFPSRVDNFIGPLSPTIKKYLDIKTQPRQLPLPTLTQMPRTVSQPKITALSSSTSTSRSNHAAPPPATSRPTHTRSASSSAAAVYAHPTRTASADRIHESSKQDGLVRATRMPPPDYIPNRPSRPASAQSHTSGTAVRSAHHVDAQQQDRKPAASDVRRALPAHSASSTDAGPSRVHPGTHPAIGSTVMANMRSVLQNPGPKRPQTTSEPKTMQSSGPRKVTLILPAGQPLINPSKSTPANAFPRKMEFARSATVTTAPSGSGPKKPTKPVSATEATASGSGEKAMERRRQPDTKSAAQPASRTIVPKSSAPALRSDAARPKPVVKSDVVHSKVAAKSGSAQSQKGESARSKPELTQSKPSQKSEPTQPKAATSGSRPGATQPTRSQLARAKSTADIKATAGLKSSTSSKPGWGRAAAATTTKTKPLSIAAGKKPASSHRVNPTKIPLPPSPTGNRRRVHHKADLQAASIPLPPSPKASSRSISPISESHQPDTEEKGIVVQETGEEQQVVEASENGQYGTDTDAANEQEDNTITQATPIITETVECDPSPDITTKVDSPPLQVQEVATNDLLPPPFQQPNGIPPQTPISMLLSSIERGFLYSPPSPLSPPINYSKANAKPLGPCPFLKPRVPDDTPKAERQALSVVENNN